MRLFAARHGFVSLAFDHSSWLVAILASPTPFLLYFCLDSGRLLQGSDCSVPLRRALLATARKIIDVWNAASLVHNCVHVYVGMKMETIVFALSICKPTNCKFCSDKEEED